MQSQVPQQPPMQNMNYFLPQADKQDICLVKACRDILVNYAAAAPRISNFDENHYIKQAQNLPWEGQRHLLNRYWNTQMMVDPANSMDERYCLLDAIHYKDWLTIFREKIVPFCIKNNLPVATDQLFTRPQ